MMNRNNRLLKCLAVIVFAGLVAVSIANARQPETVPGQWIVELEAEPSLSFRGDALLRAADSARKPLAATAPDVTGAARFDASAPAVQRYVEVLDRERSDVLAAAGGALGRAIEPHAVYRHVMNGFAASLSESEAARLAGLPGVKSVRPDPVYRLELDEGPALIGVLPLWNGSGAGWTFGEGVVIGVIDSGVNWTHRYFSDSLSFTGGYDFTNPFGTQLGECSKPQVPCNDKLIGVWNFADEGTNGKDPDGEGHGSHVASIAAGNAWQFSLQNIPNKVFNTAGVARRANIVSYKACFDQHPSNPDLNGRCTGSALNQALEQAVTDGVDIINYSIGGGATDPWSSGQVFRNVRNAGIFFVSSAGNSGPASGTITSPANMPWAMGVASSTHRRRIGQKARVGSVFNILVEPGTGPASDTTIEGPVVAADEAGDDLLGCSGFDTGSMSGSIAFIQRGDCTFETKVNNATAAGALAVLVFNNVSGPPITMGGLEGTTIPAAMMDLNQGLEALESIRGQASPIARLEAGQAAILNRDWEDVVSSFSSRGPGANAPGVMKPNVAAPGQSIIGGFVPDQNSIGILSGTSMASPHVAGAAALLKSLNPAWTPAILQSALETTAESGPMTFNDEPANMLDRGAGRIRVDRAAEIGLYLPITDADFGSANPATGGDPTALNLPGMFNEVCAGGCQFTRTVKALGAGSWTVEVEGDLPVEVSPTSFDLSTGQQQTLTVNVDVTGLPLGVLREAEVVLTPTAGPFTVQRLPVGVVTSLGELPASIEMNSASSRGGEALQFEDIAPISESVFLTSALIRPAIETFQLGADVSPDDPYNGGSGVRTFLVETTEDTLLLLAETVQSSAPDVDLYVGYDANLDGQAEEAEELCRSVSSNALEQCLIKLPAAGTWWVVVQNWQSSGGGSSDEVVLELAVPGLDDDPSLVVSGPGRHPGGDLTLNMYWDQPGMRVGERWLGALAFSSSPDLPGDGDVLPVFIRRNQNHPVETTVLFPGESRAVALAPNTTHDRLFFDVPPGVDAVNVEIIGDAGVSAELRRMDFESVVTAVPDTPPAGGTLIDSGSGSQGGFALSGAGAPGRWYVVLSNGTGTERLVEVSPLISETTPVRPQRGLWNPADRVIYQGFEWQESGGLNFLVWYSYEEDGLPMFYNAIALLAPDSSVWTADLLRTTSIGTRNNIDTVGRIGLTPRSATEMMVSWRLNGAHGTERFGIGAATSCPELDGAPVSYNGHWFAPGLAQGGTTVIVNADTQAQVRYYFDQSGTGRWVITTPQSGGSPLDDTLNVLELRGFCPTCSETGVTIEEVGSYVRVFADESHGTEIIEFDSLPPLNETFSTEVDIEKLSSRMTCQ